mmetsp:Transcript_40392/g.86734  ORF Transcript_40392/g.86734 Transcript_40392/m.86734 type:complete len:351 (+) Transcript_40392:741-1793(+)
MFDFPDQVGRSISGARMEESTLGDSALLGTQPGLERDQSSGWNVKGGPSPALAEVTVRGQVISSTLRGRPVHEPKEEILHHITRKRNDDAQYLAAKEKRVKLERTLLLEDFNEKKLLERIQNLEKMKEAETQRVQALDEREVRRKARREELDRQLTEDVKRKEEKSKLQAEEAEKLREMAAQKEARWQEQAEKRKQALEQWYAEGGEDSPHAEAVLRRRDEALLNHLIHLEAKQAARPQTLQRVKADRKTDRSREALEQRPPVPPRGPRRPLPRPSSLPPLQDQPPEVEESPGDWITQVKVVSDMYGLSETERAQTEDCLFRGIQGAGRMAHYPLPPRGPAPVKPPDARQ